MIEPKISLKYIIYTEKIEKRVKKEIEHSLYVIYAWRLEERLKVP